MNRDETEFALSTQQQAIFNGWKRPAEILRGDAVDLEEVPLITDNIDDIDLVQDVTTDCSVVASLCAAIAQVERGCCKVKAE